jgi:uroporphyrinogen decarboxylase
MNPRERIVTALERGIPDRVPVMELAIDWHVMRGLNISNYFKMIEKLDMDAVPVNQVQYLLGLKALALAVKKSYTDAWGVRRRLMAEMLPLAVAHPVTSREALRRYRPPDPSRDPVLKAVRKVARRYKGRRAVLFLGRAVFVNSWSLCGMERLLVSYLDDPEFARRLGRIALEYNMELHRLAIQAGADLIVLGDDYAHKLGPLMSPRHFREFVLPGLTEAVRNIKRAGAYCIKHTDGNIWEIIEAIVGTGIDAIGPLEPGAGMDLRRVKQRFGDRICVVGNVDVDLLCRGSAEAVREATRSLLRTVSPGGGHILSSGNSITSAVKPENFLAMLETARRYGTYPPPPR